MIIIPAIDLIGGKCVRLYQGDFSKTTPVGSDPISQIQEFINDGAELIHIVDLDGARVGMPKQYNLIKNLASVSKVPVEVGGGIRDIQTVENYVEAGVSRIILGTAAIDNKSFLKEALAKYPENIVIGIDAKNGKVATQGWESVSEVGFLDFAKEMEQFGVNIIIYTDISKDGTMAGPNFLELEQISTAVTCKIVASGGIKSMQDIQTLSNIGITEAIVGKAIYEGKIKLKRENSL